MPAASDAFPILTAMLRDALAGLVDPDAPAFLDMLADDVRLEFPYAPGEGVSVVEGISAVSAYVGGVAGSVTIDTLDVERIHRAPGSQSAILEYRITGRSCASGARYEQRYVTVIDTAGGRIVRYRDYWNPVAFAALA